MLDLSKTDDLSKASRSIGGFFAAQAQEIEKTYGFFKGLASREEALKARHEAMAKSHADQAEIAKGTAEGLDNSHEMKAYLNKTIPFHTEAQSVHKAMADEHDALNKAYAAHAEALKAQIDAMKSVAAEWGGTAVTIHKTDGSSVAVAVPANLAAATTLTDKFQVVTDALMTKALEQINNDPKVLEALQGLALETVNKLIGAKIGDKLVPSQVSAITPGPPRLVPRAGQREVSAEQMPKVDLEFQDLVKTQDDRDQLTN